MTSSSHPASHPLGTRLPDPTSVTTAALRDRCHICDNTEGVVFRQARGYQIVACVVCGTRYLSPQPTAADLTELYSQRYFESTNSVAQGYDSYVAEAANWRETFKDRLRHLPSPPPGGRLLDIGAAAGFFVEQARAVGWDAEGIEPSSWAVRYATDVLGVRVREGFFDKSAFPPRTFDLATFWEVIEHVPDPRAFFENVAGVLKPGGFLALSTPDAGSLVARILGPRWLGWQKIPEHLFFFDLPSLTYLLAQSGFEVVSHRYVSLTVSAGFAAERLALSLGFPRIARVLAQKVGERPVRVNCFYDLMVVARLKSG